MMIKDDNHLIGQNHIRVEQNFENYARKNCYNMFKEIIKYKE